MINIIFFVVINIIFLLGATGNYASLPYFLILFVTLFFVGVRLIQDKKIYFPKNFGLYVAFVASVIANQIIAGGDLLFLELFITAGLVWFLVYNNNFFSKHFFPALVFLGMAMVGYYVFALKSGYEYLPQNLYHTVSPEVKHNHIGDLWALIMVATFYKLTQKFRLWHLLLLLSGLVILIISLSRSALLSLFTGIFYIVYMNREKKELKGIFKIVSAVLLVVFLYFALTKTTLFSRPYYWEAVRVIFSHPLGIGFGNFSHFQSDTSWVHNIILEIILGGGVVSVFFLVWLYKVFKLYLQDTGEIFYKAIFLAIFVNFLFDITYVNPTMFWLWFSVLALFKKNPTNIKLT